MAAVKKFFTVIGKIIAKSLNDTRFTCTIKTLKSHTKMEAVLGRNACLYMYVNFVHGNLQHVYA